MKRISMEENTKLGLFLRWSELPSLIEGNTTGLSWGQRKNNTATLSPSVQ